MSPFHSLEEWYLTIPPGQILNVPNIDFKLVLFLEGKVALGIPGHPPIKLMKGDAYSLSLPVTQTYHSLSPDRDTHLHFLRLAFRWPASALPAPAGKPGKRPEARFEAALRRRLSGFQAFPHTLFGDHYQISRRILSEIEHQDEAAAWKISGLCQTLAADLIPQNRHPQSHAPVPRRQGDAAVEHALQYLQENCHEALTLPSIAWQVQLSGEHLARLFKHHTGRTVFEWLDDFRTEKARNLLVTTEWPLARVARACGYSSASLLSRHFKQNTGQPPIEFRVKARKGERFSPSQLSLPPDPFSKKPNR